MLSGNTLLISSYDYRLVALSVVIAIFASYAALDLAGRVTAAKGRARAFWLIGGATAMGLGIWSMHFVGMLAFNLPTPMRYDWPTVLASLLAAILASAVALYVVSQQRMGLPRAFAGSVVMGAGISAMHYIGMAAMRLAAMCRFDPWLVALSVALAIVISFVAMWLAFLAREESKSSVLRKIASAVVMGAAIPVMHYTGMAAASFMASNAPPDLTHAIGISALGTAAITMGTVMVLAAVVLTSVFHRRYSAQTTELESVEQRYRLLFDGNPQPMWVYDLQSLAFLEVNKAALEQYGFSRDEFLHMIIRDIRPTEHVHALFGNVPQEVAEFEKSGTWKHRKKSGALIDVEITSHNFDWAGRPAKLVLATDVTEQKLLEKQLRQSQKMEAVGQLSSGIAHDFNNLLGVIIGYGEVLEKRLPQGDVLHQHCEEITKAGQKAASLTRQLLAFSRQQVLEPKILDLNAIVLDVDKMLRRLIGEDIDLRAVLDEALGCTRADQGQMEQVIINLAVNARDAMPEGGTLTIETANVEVDEEFARQHPPQPPGPYILLAISDTGIGMDTATQARIFEPFFTTKEVGKGTGLGLSTVYGIVRQSGGHIWVYSRPGEGTTFKIYLPRTEEAVLVQKPTASLTTSMRASETILLVEDEEALRKLTRILLTESGYAVLEAKHTDNAVEIARQHSGPIHLLLTDVVMPGTNGFALAENLAAIRPEMKVIYMSGYAGFKQRALFGSKAFVLSKPFTEEALLSRVHEVLALKAEPEGVVQPSR